MTAVRRAVLRAPIDMHDLIHINESLSGPPFDVRFYDFNDIKNGVLKDTDVLINAGAAGTAWSGGDAWNDEEVLRIITEWVCNGGTFIGVNEPSAASGYDSYFRMAHVLGIDEDTGDRVCHGRWTFDVSAPPLLYRKYSLKSHAGVQLHAWQKLLTWALP